MADGTNVKSIETPNQTIPPESPIPLDDSAPRVASVEPPAQVDNSLLPVPSKRAIKRARKLAATQSVEGLASPVVGTPAGNSDPPLALPPAVPTYRDKTLAGLAVGVQPEVPEVAGHVRDGKPRLKPAVAKPAAVAAPKPAGKPQAPKPGSPAPAPERKPEVEQKPAKPKGKPASESKDGKKPENKPEAGKPQVPKGPPPVVPPPAVPAPPPVREIDVRSYLEPVIQSAAPTTFVAFNEASEALRKLLVDGLNGPKMAWLQCFNKLWLERPLRVKKGFEYLAADFEVNFSHQSRADASTHPIAHFVRSVAEREAVCRLMKYADETGSTQVIDMFGSERICIAVNDVLSRLPEKTKFTWFRPLVTNKDYVNFAASLHKRPSVVPIGMPVLLEDCYVPKDEFFNNLNTFKIPYAVVLTQIYRSESMGGMMHGEGPFFQKDGKFIQMASATDPAWAPCESNDWWLSTNNYQGYAWDVSRQYGDFYVITVKFLGGEKPVVEPLKPVPLGSCDLVQKKVILPPSFWTVEGMRHWWNSLGRGITHEELWVCTEALEKFGTAMVGKNRQPFQMSTLTQEISIMLNTPKYMTFCRVAEFDSTRLLRDTVAYITWSTVWEETSMFNKVLHSFGETILNYRNMKTKMVPTPSDSTTFLKYWATKVLLLTVVYKIVRFIIPIVVARSKVRLSVFADLFVKPDVGSIPETFRQIFVHPLLTQLLTLVSPAAGSIVAAVTPCAEEYVKTTILAPFEERVGLPRGISYGVFEGALSNYKERTWSGLLKIFMHTFFQHTPNPEFTHSLWNLAAYTQCASITKWLDFKSPTVGSLLAVAWSLRGRKLATLPGGREPPISPAQFERQRQEDEMIPALVKFVPTFGTVSDAEDWKLSYEVRTNTDQMIPGILPLTYELAALPFDVEADPRNCPVAQELVVKKEPGVFVFIGVQCLMRRPYGVRHFYNALEQRNLKTIPALDFCERNCPFFQEFKMPGEKMVEKAVRGCKLRKLWFYAATLFEGLVYFGDMDEGPISLQEWALKMKGSMKRQRAFKAIEDRKENNLNFSSTLFLKSDEVLWPKDDGYIKARVIKAVNPTVQAYLAKPIDSAMKRLKMFCDGEKTLILGPTVVREGWRNTLQHPVVDNTFQEEGRRPCEFRIAIGSGKTAQELSEWFQRSYEWVGSPRAPGVSRYSMIVAGDDFFCIYIEKGYIVMFAENDFSSFDRTEGTHALEAESRILKALGVSSSKIGILFRGTLATASYEDRHFELRERIELPDQRATGGPDTTIGNSVLNVTSVLFGLEAAPMESLAEEQAKLGFIAKLKLSSNFLGMTFLKGWWLPLDEICSGLEYAWLPLPSQVIKLGKIMTDPVRICPLLSVDEAWRSAAKAMAAGLGHVPRTYPILGPLLHRYDNLIKTPVETLQESYMNEVLLSSVMQDPHKVVNNLFDIKLKLESCHIAIAIRYGLDRFDVYCMEQTILAAPFPSILPQEGFINLGRVDYG